MRYAMQYPIFSLDSAGTFAIVSRMLTKASPMLSEPGGVSPIISPKGWWVSIVTQGLVSRQRVNDAYETSPSSLPRWNWQIAKTGNSVKKGHDSMTPNESTDQYVQ